MVVICFIIEQCLCAFQCTPVRKAWEFEISGRCIDPLRLIIGVRSTNVAIEYRYYGIADVCRMVLADVNVEEQPLMTFQGILASAAGRWSSQRLRFYLFAFRSWRLFCMDERPSQIFAISFSRFFHFRHVRGPTTTTISTIYTSPVKFSRTTRISGNRPLRRTTTSLWRQTFHCSQLWSRTIWNSDGKIASSNHKLKIGSLGLAAQ